jgi:hypothetical protein
MTNDTAKLLLSKIMEKKAAPSGAPVPLANRPTTGEFNSGSIFKSEPGDVPFPYSSLTEMLNYNIVRPASRAFNAAGGALGQTAYDAYSNLSNREAPVVDFKSIGKGILNTPSNLYKGTRNAIGELFSTLPEQKAFDAQLAQNQATNQTAHENKLIQRLALLGLAAGAGVGGVHALRQWMKPKKRDDDGTDVAVPYPVARGKVAGDGDMIDLNYWLGTQPDKPSLLDNPYFMPAIGATGLASLYGGWKGTKYLTDAVLAKKKKDEQNKAKDEFHQALLASYQTPLSHDPMHKKKASATTDSEMVGQEIDVLYDLVVKHAGEGDPTWSTGSFPSDVLKGTLPLYLTYALASGLGTGALAYDMTRKNSKAEALKKALRDRARMQYDQSPPELHAIPEAVDLDARKKRPSSVV